MSLEGTWNQSVPFDGMEAVLDAVGMNDPQTRGFILAIKPTLELSRDGEQWTYKMSTPQADRTVSFKNGQEIDYVSVVGKPVKATMTVEGSTLTEVHRDPTDPSKVTTISREVSGDTMNVTMKVSSAICKTQYIRA
ncbi:hypothetical protein CAPTEDRAFT_227713 [Capitella teleta]|uniref:Lipocalin/cytosolic fatty-acid binding domain-containing protein n=1 Tax=Capitella teleta TaxID=283909 RepID=R7U183_CAPTE|nr:hypothetical protein CAPTEDRAFT_227713 [Capitella teleta]|eukprot:ELT99642.1 hypothetical protein CAPTEDRAFT_227713 [Capitella teleta]